MLTNDSLAVKNKFAFYSVITFFLLLIVLIGYGIRIIPAETRPQVGYSFDRAFHFRMTLEASTKGYVPDIDMLSLYPEGKDITAQLPVLMYYMAAAYHKFINIFGDFTLSNSCDSFSALMGALIAVPIFFISLSFSNNVFASLIAALIAVIIPAHFRRTFCFWFKYEGIGTLLFLFSFQFFIQAIASVNKYKNILFSLLFSSAFVLMLATWRLAIFVYVLYFLFAFLLHISYKFNRNSLTAFTTLFLFTALSTVYIKYLEANAFITSNIMIVSFSIVMASLFAYYIKKNFLLKPKVQIFIPLISFGALAIPLLLISKPTIYQNFNSLFFIRLMGYFGKEIPVTGINKVLLFTQELRIIEFSELFSNEIYSAVFFFLFLLPFSLKIKKQNHGQQIFTKEQSIVYLFFVLLFCSSILFFRNKVLAAPFFACIALDCIMPSINNLKKQKFLPYQYFTILLVIFSGALIASTFTKLFTTAIRSNMLATEGSLFKIIMYISKTLSAWDMSLNLNYIIAISIVFIGGFVVFMRFYTEQKNPFTLLSVFILTVSLFLIFKTADDVVFMSSRTANRFAPSQTVIKWVRENIKLGTPLLSYWGQGYTTQLYTGCPTLFDGFLENEKIRKRILDFEKSFCEEDENILYNLCKAHYTNYIIMPTFKTLAIAQTAGIPYDKFVTDRKNPLPTAFAMRTVLFKMIYKPKSLKKFDLVYAEADYRIFKLK